MKDLRVLVPCGESEWATPTFVIPKKDGSPLIIHDFPYLNGQWARKIYPIPNINELLHKHSGFTYVTKIDISMAYYTFELDEESQNLCIITLSWGKYKYLCLPRGISAVPDLFQAVISQLLGQKRGFL